MTIDKDLEGVLKPPIPADAEDLEAKTLRQLYEEKKARLGLSDRKIQSLLDMPRNVIDPILNGTVKQINLINFIKVANFLGIEFDKLAAAYLPEMNADAIGSIQRSRDAGFLTERFDLKTLEKSGFLPAHASVTDIVRRITTFFGIGGIYEYPIKGIGAAFSRTRRDSCDKMRDFWACSAYVQFEEIGNPFPYDRAKLVELIPKIRPYSRNEEHGLIAVLRSLYTTGVTVIYQPHLGGEQVRGATMCVGEKPCIVISDLNNLYPTLWFALMHELYHVLYDFDDIRTETYHVSDGKGDLILTNEDKADHFARQYLLSDDKLALATAYIDAPTSLNAFASEWGIHPSIIYASYCFRHGQSAWKRYRGRIPDMGKALRGINVLTFQAESLKENAKRIKELFNV